MNKDDMSEQVRFAYDLADFITRDYLDNDDISDYIRKTLPSYHWKETRETFKGDLIANILDIALSNDEQFAQWKNPIVPDPSGIAILEEYAEDLSQRLAALRKKIDGLKGE